MRLILSTLGFILLFTQSCTDKKVNSFPENRLKGSWQLISSEAVTKTKTEKENLDGKKMIKLITGSHFAFLNHDLNSGKDSTASFVAGGGSCSFTDSTYSEYLEYCNYRDWEGLKVNFRFKLNNDTLILTGIEKKEDIKVDHLLVEKYKRIGN